MALGLYSTKILVYKSTGTGKEALGRQNLDDVTSGSLQKKRTVTWLPAQETMNMLYDRSIMTLSEEEKE